MEIMTNTKHKRSASEAHHCSADEKEATDTDADTDQSKLMDRSSFNQDEVFYRKMAIWNHGLRRRVVVERAQRDVMKRLRERRYKNSS
jgi:translation elongation factor P/translation initiation factor 5A